MLIVANESNHIDFVTVTSKIEKKHHCDGRRARRVKEEEIFN